MTSYLFDFWRIYCDEREMNSGFSKKISRQKYRMITNKMAAKAIQIQTTKRKRSKRIRAANKFLSNISLDGSTPKDKAKKEKIKTKFTATLDKEEEEMLSNPAFHQRPKLLTSFSTTNAIEEEENLDPTGSAFSTTACHLSSPVERSYNRTTSLRESKFLTDKFICVSSRKLTKYRGDLLGRRIMLCSSHQVPFAVYSILKYSQEEKGVILEKGTYRLRRMSGEYVGDSCGIQGVDMGAKDKPVSYGHLLVPTSGIFLSPRTMISSPRRTSSAVSSSLTCQEPRSSFQTSSFSSNSTIAGCSPVGKMLSPRDYLVASHGEQSCDNYDPLLLDDPELRSGRHRKVLRLSSFMVSIIEYVKPSQLKKDLNEQFKEKFPNLEITLSKLRSVKRDLVKLAIECSLDHSTIAYSSVYFEKLVLWGKINKMNRKLVAGSCLLLAAKFNNDLKKSSVKELIDSISDLFHVSTKDLLLFEIQALIALEFNLHLPSSQLLPHIKRLEYSATSFM